MSKSVCQQIVMMLGAISFGYGLHQTITPDFWGKEPYSAYFNALFYTALGICFLYAARKEGQKDKNN
jgi:hypothetical protein